MLLEGRRLLVTGVLTESSIAFSIARRAQEEGAELVLTGFGRGLRITQRVARRLPTEPDVLELDVNDPEQLAAVAKELDGRWGRLDGLVHAIAFVPGDALGGNFLTAPSASAIAAFETSAFSLKALAAAMLPLLERARGARAARSSASTSTPRSPGPPTTGPACRRPRSRRSAATSPATSGRAACAPTSSRRAR